MMNLKNEKGSISLIAIISVLFLTSFLISTYLIMNNKAKTQLEVTKRTMEIYNNADEAEQIYNNYFNKGVIPIYTAEQLTNIGTGDIVEINGRKYIFSNAENTSYILMSNIEIEEDWSPDNIPNDINFEWNGHTVTVNINESTTIYPIVINDETGTNEDNTSTVETTVTAEEQINEENNNDTNLINAEINNM